MGYHYTERLFKLVRNTDATQQLVLAVLAHMTDDKTGKCYPSIGTIAESARLHRTTVIKVLDVLRQNGLLSWVNRIGKKPNKLESNLYTLKLPDFPKANDVTPVANDDQSQSSKETSSVAHGDSPGSPQLLPQSPKTTTPVAQDYYPSSPKLLPQSPKTTPPVAQNYPIINRTYIEHNRKGTENTNTPQGASGSVSGGNMPVSLGESGILDKIVEEVKSMPEDAIPASGMDVVMNLTDAAMKAVQSNSEEDRVTFRRIFQWRDHDACREEIYQIECKLKAGEKFNNPAAALTNRLMALPRVYRQRNSG